MVSFTQESTAEEVATHFSSEIKDKVILTTGVSPSGLGAYFVETVAAHSPRLLILAGRDPSKTRETADTISKSHPNVAVRTLKLDLGDLAQVREAAKEVLAYSEAIDVLVNNAAVMACDYATTKDGFEMQFGVSHLGHFLFTNLIMSKLLAAPKPRVVNVSSDGHRLGGINFDDPGFANGATYNRWTAYGQAKSANMLFATSLANKSFSDGKHLTAISLHPGVIMTTNLGRHVGEEDFGDLIALDKKLGNYEASTGLRPVTVSQGTATHVFAAFNPELEAVNGAYCLEVRVSEPREVRMKATDAGLAERLWGLSNLLVGENF